MLTIEADIYEYVRMSYVDKNILGPLVHMHAIIIFNRKRFQKVQLGLRTYFTIIET